MKELFITANGAIMLDKNADVATSVDQDASSIRRVYLVDEDCTVKYKEGTIEKSIDVKAGQIIVVFYHGTLTNPIAIVDSEDWANGIKEYREEERKRRIEWAEKQNKSELCDNCESISR